MTDEEIELAKKLLTQLSPLDKGPSGDLMRRYLRWKVKYGTRKKQLRN